MTRYIIEAEHAIKNAEKYIVRRSYHKRQALIDYCDEMTEYFIDLARSQVRLARRGKTTSN